MHYKNDKYVQKVTIKKSKKIKFRSRLIVCEKFVEIGPKLFEKLRA